MEILGLFGVDWKLILAQLVNFAIVVAVLWWFAIKPLMKVMDQRNQEISTGLEDAKKSAEHLRNAEVEFKERLRQAKKEADEILQLAKQQAEKGQQATLEKTRQEVKHVILESKQRLANEKESMLAEAKQEIVQMVVLSLHKILSDNLGKDIDQKYIERVLNGISKDEKKSS